MDQTQYYLCTGQIVTGPFLLQQILWENEKQFLDESILICQAGAETWVPLLTFLEELENISLGSPTPTDKEDSSGERNNLVPINRETNSSKAICRNPQSLVEGIYPGNALKVYMVCRLAVRELKMEILGGSSTTQTLRVKVGASLTAWGDVIDIQIKEIDSSASRIYLISQTIEEGGITIDRGRHQVHCNKILSLISASLGDPIVDLSAIKLDYLTDLLKAVIKFPPTPDRGIDFASIYYAALPITLFSTHLTHLRRALNDEVAISVYPVGNLSGLFCLTDSRVIFTLNKEVNTKEGFMVGVATVIQALNDSIADTHQFSYATIRHVGCQTKSGVQNQLVLAVEGNNFEINLEKDHLDKVYQELLKRIGKGNEDAHLASSSQGLIGLAKLLENGLLTKEEFEKEKKKIIG